MLEHIDLENEIGLEVELPRREVLLQHADPLALAGFRGKWRRVDAQHRMPLLLQAREQHTTAAADLKDVLRRMFSEQFSEEAPEIGAVGVHQAVPVLQEADIGMP